MPGTLDWQTGRARMVLTVAGGFALSSVSTREHGPPAGMRTTFWLPRRLPLSMSQANRDDGHPGKAHDHLWSLT